MTENEKIAMIRALVDNDPTASDDLIKVYLRLAIGKMMERLYPFDATKEESDIPERYETIECELAARLFLRRGGEGESNHEENGVNRTYASVDDEDLLSRLTPFAKVGG
jgi:hypothetical protein